jgi:polysaccharide biosynthesis transport protein
MIWDQKLLVTVVTLVVVAAAAYATSRKLPIYRASGMIELRQPGDEVVPVEALFQLPRIADQHLETQYALLRSPILARRVAEAVWAPSAEPDTPSESVEADLASAARWVRAGLLIDPLRGSRLVRVHFDGPDPEVAAQIVNEVFIQYQALRQEAALSAVNQLMAQADTVRARLVESEELLQRFVRENQLQFVESRAGDTENILHDRLRRLQQELTVAEADRFRKEATFSLAEDEGVDHLDGGAVQALNLRIIELRTEYARLRSNFTDDYPRTRQVREQLDELEDLMMQERGRVLARLRTDLESARSREGLLRDAFDQQKRLIDGLASSTAEYHFLQREVDGQLALYLELQHRRKEAEVSAAMARTEVSLVEPAVVPQAPIRPLPQRDLPVAALVGLMLGVGLALVREHTDTAVRTAEEVRSVSDVPVLGFIPSAGLLGSGGGLGEEGVRRILSEAFGGLRTSVLFDVHGPVPRSILVTSTHPGEGKSTISLNLALSLANLGRKVLLVDGDIRRPVVHATLGLDRGPGLAEHLAGQVAWTDVLQPEVAPGLDVIVAGTRPESPADLLTSPRMSELVRTAALEYDFVILDSPAFLINAADARILSALVDAVILVVRSGATPRDQLRMVLRQTPNVMGVVLNDLNVRDFGSYYGYDSEPEPHTTSRRRDGDSGHRKRA